MTRSKHQNILLVEDHRDCADMLALILEADGYEVHVAMDAVQALAALERIQPTIAIIDVGLPGMDGYQLAMRVREKASCAVIAVSGFEKELDEPRASVFDEYFLKPVDYAHLRTSIMRLGAVPRTSG